MSRTSLFSTRDGTSKLIERMKAGQPVTARELAAADSDVKLNGERVDLAGTVENVTARPYGEAVFLAAPIAGATAGSLLGPFGAALGFAAGAAVGVTGAYGARAKEEADREALSLFARLQGPDGFTRPPRGVELEVAVRDVASGAAFRDVD